MRTLRLGRTFDAVLVHDAIDYMTTEADLRAALTTAYAHCERVALFLPDEITETFEPSTDHGGTGDVRYLEWTTTRTRPTPGRSPSTSSRCAATRRRAHRPRDAPHGPVRPRDVAGAAARRGFRDG